MGAGQQKAIWIISGLQRRQACLRPRQREMSLAAYALATRPIGRSYAQGHCASAGSRPVAVRTGGARLCRAERGAAVCDGSPRGSVILDDNGLAEGRPVIKSGLTAQVHVGDPEQILRSGLFGRMSAPIFPISYGPYTARTRHGEITGSDEGHWKSEWRKQIIWSRRPDGQLCWH